MDKDKEMDDMRHNLGKIIFYKIADKIQNIRSMAYEPKYIVVWVDYYKALHIYASEMGLFCYGRGEPDRIFGLKIVITQLPDTLEVY